MKKYVIQIEFTEGSDEFWDDINRRGVTGCDDMLELVHNNLYNSGFCEDDCKIKLVRFEDD